MISMVWRWASAMQTPKNVMACAVASTIDVLTARHARNELMVPLIDEWNGGSE